MRRVHRLPGAHRAGLHHYGDSYHDRGRRTAAQALIGQALTTAQNDPDAQEPILLLAEALRQAAHEDPGFGREILALWGQAQFQITNIFRGWANKVVQLHDVHGDLTIT